MAHLTPYPSVDRKFAPASFAGRRGEWSAAVVDGMEFKAVGGADIAVDYKKRRVELWVAGFGTVDLGRDLMLKGCAAESIAEHHPQGLIKFFWNHEIPLGPVEVVEEHDEGIYLVGNVTPHPEFDRYLAQIQDKTAEHGSLGYTVLEAESLPADEVQKRYGVEASAGPLVRVIKKIRIWEGSAVVWPMNEVVKVVGVGTKKEKGMKQGMETKGLADFAEAVRYADWLKYLTEADWAKMDEEEVEIAQNLLGQMTEMKSAIETGLRERKSSAGSASSGEVGPDEFKTLLEAAFRRGRLN